MAPRMPESAVRVTQASTQKATIGRCMRTPRSRADRDKHDDRQIARRYDSGGRLKTNEFSNGYDVRRRRRALARGRRNHALRRMHASLTAVRCRSRSGARRHARHDARHCQCTHMPRPMQRRTPARTRRYSRPLIRAIWNTDAYAPSRSA
ncbi:hypothetical protein DIE06_05310 [Burkholderia sp. Bp8998]|nr:hypothetical protein DIE06_05310 [Burkholderia sp. Bp8998]